MYDNSHLSPEWKEKMQKQREADRERAKQDLMTKRKRRLPVTVTDDQLTELKEFAKRHNITVDAILSNYIADLTQTHSNGSDERERARSYFDRTHLSWMYKDDQK